MIKSRFLFKTDTYENWTESFTPEKGELCIFTKSDKTPKLKIGNGNNNAIQLPFVSLGTPMSDAVINSIIGKANSSALGSFVLGSSVLA